MTPFHHPTSILVLDDDPLFLESLDFQFSEEVSCQTFTRPDAALEHLRAQAGQHPNFARYFRDVFEIAREIRVLFGLGAQMLERCVGTRKRLTGHFFAKLKVQTF